MTEEEIIEQLQAKLKDAMECLEFYAEGHNPYLKHDCDRIPVIKSICLQTEFANGKSARQVISEAEKPAVKYKSGKRAREALARIRG